MNKTLPRPQLLRTFLGIWVILAVAFGLMPLSPAAAATTSTTTSLVATGAKWTYLNAAEPTTSMWKAPQYNITRAWRSGLSPLGHLNPARTDVGKPNRTVYFRISFEVTDPTIVKSMKLTSRVDDGAVFFLNGARIAAVNMPDTAIRYATPALSAIHHDGNNWDTFQVPATTLRKGLNVLTAEVHQADSNGKMSTDLSFDARLDAEVAAAPSSKLYWSDEFNDTNYADKWRARDGLYGHGDADVVHCNKVSNVTEQSGFLRLKAQPERMFCENQIWRDYTTGYANTRDKGIYLPLYGRYEARVRVPHGQGLWPGLWLRHREGSSVGEVDIMEGAHSSFPGQVAQTLHFPTTIGSNVDQKMTKIEDPVPGTGGWHTYAVEISQVVPGSDNAIRFEMFIDGVKTMSYVNNHGAALAKGDKMAAWDIALTYYVGGKWIGQPDKQLGYYANANGGVCAQTWRPPANGNPANCPTKNIWLAPWENSPTFDIDYIRVYSF